MVRGRIMRALLVYKYWSIFLQCSRVMWLFSRPSWQLDRLRDGHLLCHPFGRDVEAVVAELYFELDLIAAELALVAEFTERTLGGEGDVVPCDLAVLDGRLILRASHGAAELGTLLLEGEGVHSLSSIRRGELGPPFAGYIRGQSRCRDQCSQRDDPEPDAAVLHGKSSS